MAKFKHITRNCKNCGKPFMATRKWHWYCPNGGKCRVAHWRKLHPHIDPEDLKQIKEKLGISE